MDENEVTECNMDSLLNSSHENEDGVATPPNSQVSIVGNESNQSDTNFTLNSSHENDPDAVTSISVADDVICVSDSAHLNRHRPMHYDMISGGYSFKHTVQLNILNFSIQLKCNQSNYNHDD